MDEIDQIMITQETHEMLAELFAISILVERKHGGDVTLMFTQWLDGVGFSSKALERAHKAASKYGIASDDVAKVMRVVAGQVRYVIARGTDDTNDFMITVTDNEQKEMMTLQYSGQHDEADEEDK